MFLNMFHMIADFIVLVTRLTTEEPADEQRMILIDQFIHFQGLDAAFGFDLHDLLMIVIMALTIIFGGHGISQTAGHTVDSRRIISHNTRLRYGYGILMTGRGMKNVDGSS